MLRVFVDASVLFAATYSHTGAASDLMMLGSQYQAELLITAHLLNEVERNIARKAPELHDRFDKLLEGLNPEITARPPEELIVEVAAKPDYLVTYDRKHLLDRPEVAARSGLNIVTPDVVVKLIEDAA